MKSHGIRRFTAGLLAFLMICSLLYSDTSIVNAADTSSSQTSVQVTDNAGNTQQNESTEAADKQDGAAVTSSETAAADDSEASEDLGASDISALSDGTVTAMDVTTVTGGDTISAGGIYTIADGAAGTITVTATDAVTLTGKGGNASAAFSGLSVNCTTAGANLTIDSLAISSPASGTNMFNFTGTGNKFYFKGTNLLECNTNMAGKAMLHAGTGTDLTIDGSGSDAVLYLYKNDQSAAIGGNSAENNGAITINGGTIFAKGTKQGATIGQGANTGSASVSGDITINGGTLYLIANSRGAALGGSAGSSGGSAGGNVYIKGGSVSINLDYSGAAIGGGGNSSGNDAAGGNLYVTGGSLRTYIDANAVSSWTAQGVAAEGVSDKAITAAKTNAANESVYLLKVDTSLLKASADTYTVSIDGTSYYSGGLHAYKYVNQSLLQSAQTNITDTKLNWTADNDKNLYLYVTGKDHAVTINGETYGYLWDADAQSFSLQVPTVAAKVTGGTTETPGGTVTVSEAKPAAGDTITVTASANSGYYLAQVRYADTRVAIGTEAPSSFTYTALKANSDGTYSFTMPDSDVTVYADFISVVWDGTIDVSWYDPSAASYHVQYPAQLEGLAAVDNGLFNDYPSTGTNLIPYVNTDGTPYGSTEELYNTYKISDTSTTSTTVVGDIHKIQAAVSSGTTGANNQTTTNDYWFGGVSTSDTAGRTGWSWNDFTGKTIYIDADLDMGGTGSGTSWSGPNYMPIGGQYCLNNASGYTKLSASFNGTFDGQGHIVYNIYCNRYAPNFGDAQSVGLIGRLGVHDSDPSSLYTTPAVRNVAVAGYIYSRRSVGGIVGKNGKSNGSVIENCINFATIKNTDSKGVGGIAGAGWNKLTISNCVNFGNIYAGRQNAGGISGSCEASVNNCYNFGYVGAISERQAQAMGTNNGGAVWTNCYYLTGSSMSTSNPAVYGGTAKDTITAVSTPEELATNAFLTKINGTGRGWVSSKNQTFISSMLSSCLANVKTYGSALAAYDCTGMPVPRAFIKDTAVITEFSTSGTPVSDYVAGQTFDKGTLVITAHYSDDTTDTVSDYKVTTETGNETLTESDTYVTVSGTKEGHSYSYTYPVTVSENVLSGISVTAQPLRTIYGLGETFDPSGMAVTAKYTNGSSAVITDYTVSPSGSLSSGDTKVTVSYTYYGKTETADVAITVLDSAAPTKSEDGYYELYTASDMIWFSSIVYCGKEAAANGRLMADIDLSSVTWTPIGYGYSEAKYYSGNFDGNGKTVNLTYNISNSYVNYVGLFGRLGTAGSIHDLTVTGSVSGTTNVGGIVGCSAGAITNCTNKAVVTSSSGKGGGIAGSAEGGTIVNCSSYGKITGSGTANDCGGIVGRTTAATVKGCMNYGAASGYYNIGGIAGNVYGSDTVTECGNYGDITVDCTGYLSATHSAGGIAGYVYQTGTVSSCFNKGTVVSNDWSVGGIVGYVNSSTGTVENCYNGGTVSSTMTGTPYVGGIVGRGNNASGKVQNCYNYGAVSTTGTATYVGGVVGYANGTTNVSNNYYLTGSAAIGLGKSTDNTTAEDAAALKTISASLGDAFKESNAYTNSGYPVLTWQTLNSAVVPEKIVVANAPAKTLYTAGDAFDAAGMAVTAYLSDGTSTAVTDFTVAPAVLSASDKKAVISYKLNGITVSTEQNIDVLSSGVPALNEDGYYELADADDLEWFQAQAANGITYLNGIVTADIDVSDISWTPIGTSALPYAGLFNGNGHVITYSCTVKTYGGLFGAAADAEIKDLTVKGTLSSEYTLDEYIGGIVGYTKDTTISGCTNEVSVSASGGHSAGIVGCAEASTITGCVNNGNVSCSLSAGSGVGGIVGYSSSNTTADTISDCSNNGDVTGGSFVGGILGYSYGADSITKCSNSGTIKGTYATAGNYGTGGIAGSCMARTTIDECFNDGTITGVTANIGGIAGANASAAATITNCYNRGEVSGSNTASTAAAGGILGLMNVMSATVKNCYNTGNITLNGANAYVSGTTGYIGAVIGKATAVTNAANNYYLAGTAGAGLTPYTSAVTDNTVSETADSLKALSATLGTSYKESNTFTNAGYPVLEWQTLNTQNVVEKITVTSGPAKTDYTENEKFNSDGMVVTALYSDGTTKNVNSYTYAPVGKLLPENTTIYISYTENGVTKTAQQYITVKKLGSDSSLSSLSFSPGKFDSEFTSDSHVYTSTVDYDAQKTYLTAAATDANATVTVKKGSDTPSALASGARSLQLLSLGDNVFTITVTAENGRDKTDYIVTVTRQLSSVCTLDSLAISEGTMDPAFDANTQSYAASVADTVSQFDITAKRTDAVSTMTVQKGNAEPVSLTDGTAVTQQLDYGENVFKIEVTAQNGTDKTSYTLTVTRAHKSMSYKDVPAGSWYNDAVQFAKDQGLMTGLTDDTFGPEQNICRAQFAAILYRMAGSPEVTYSAKFPDVPEKSYYTSAVLWANSVGVISGYSNGKFGPSDNVTREQIAVMLYRYANYMKYDTTVQADLSTYPDASSVSAFAADAMKWAVGIGLISGDGGSLKPQNSATRAQCAIIIMRYMNHYAD